MCKNSIKSNLYQNKIYFCRLKFIGLFAWMVKREETL